MKKLINFLISLWTTSKTQQPKEPSFDPTPIFEEIVRREGCFVNNVLDRGGPTKYGISWVHNKNYLLDIGISRDTVNQLTQQEAVDIYYKKYYKTPKIDKLPEELQENVLDFAVHSGPTRAVKTLQKVLKVAQDGVLGPVTLSKIKSWKESKGLKSLNKQILDLREKFLRDIVELDSTQKVFLDGWINRVNEIREKIE